MVKRFVPILLLLALCWMVFVVNNLIMHGDLNQYGIRPRHTESLPGIIWSPFLHGSFRHLMTNTLPLAFLGGLLGMRGRAQFWIVTTAGIVFSGGLTWLIGRNAYHIGASGLIFCFFGYLVSLAFFERKIGTVILSIICVGMYGGLVRGILPSSSAVSWEGHLAGASSGIFLAWMLSNINQAKEISSVPKHEPRQDLRELR
jgi:membrane associated rhomboid family serine protease